MATRVRYDVFGRPHYAYGVYSAADLAKRLGLSAIQVIEFGVAGGNGLIALEDIAAAVASELGIQIHVCGFDCGGGMPAPDDYRDLPHVWEKGFYTMDVAKLKARLKAGTDLILGDLSSTLASWTPKARIGFIAFDLDYYSSTKRAFSLLERESENSLPRVYCYFDDVVWPERALYNHWVGELCAIREFNEAHSTRKLCPIHLLRHTRIHQSAWNDQMYAYHDFEHPLYCTMITPAGAQYSELPL
ncbi:MAG: hypothetical protein ABSB35_30100 [Bryobacteraceae bacterium]